MLYYTICAFLAPAVASAMAFPWAFPEPTLIIPEKDQWSPAPTQGPKIGQMELFRRADEDNTCGYVSGESSSSLTCLDEGYVCATNTYYGVHGCCDPKNIETCSLPTTCIASTDLAASCTDAACSTNQLITKCTNSNQPYCYQWLYYYSTRTIMTEHGCAASAFTVEVQRTFTDGASDASSVALPSEIYITVTAPVSESSDPPSTQTSNDAQSLTASPSSSNTSPASPGKKTPIGAIVGGVVGGLAVLAALIFGIVFLLMRKRRENKASNPASQPMMGGGPAPGVTEYKPQGMDQGYNAGAWQAEQKPGFTATTTNAHMGMMGNGNTMVGPDGNMYYNAGMGGAPQMVAEAGGREVASPPGQQGWGKPVQGQPMQGQPMQGQPMPVQGGHVYEAPA